MKKAIGLILVCAALTAVGSQSVFAEEPMLISPAPQYTINVCGRAAETEDIPCQPYYEGESLMVPLRKISEALGYKVTWDSDSGKITVDDDYIQKASLSEGTSEAVFEGRLKVINMSRTVENSAKTVIHGGYTYVPLDFFKEFMNDTEVDGKTINVSPSMAQICE